MGFNEIPMSLAEFYPEQWKYGERAQLVERKWQTTATVTYLLSSAPLGALDILCERIDRNRRCIEVNFDARLTV